MDIDTLEKLEQLAELKKKGLITQEEIERIKAELLYSEGSMPGNDEISDEDYNTSDTDASINSLSEISLSILEGLAIGALVSLAMIYFLGGTAAINRTFNVNINSQSDTSSSHRDNIKTVQEKDEQVFKQQSRDFVQKYILARTSFSDTDTGELWYEVAEMSSAEVWNEFKNTKEDILQRIKKYKLSCQTTILNIEEIGNNIWQVKFQANYHIASTGASKSVKYYATMQIKKDSLNNYGFEVIKYKTRQIKE